VQLNVNQHEIIIKVVYYGPPLSGKTSNLQAIHQQLNPAARERLMVLDTADDRTLFFDLLPVSFQSESGYRVKLKLFTVPGQLIHTVTRKLVLSGADGVAFIADSQIAEAKRNNEFWNGMRRNLAANGLDPDDLPVVIQFNKRDLPQVRSDGDLETLGGRSTAPIFKAVAIRGEGVVETLYGLLTMIMDRFVRLYDFENKFNISRELFLAGIFGEDEARALAQKVRLEQR
jgi:signal recognition particle receptor subunit beta